MSVLLIITGNFFANVGNSIVGAAASYATKKLVNSEGTWNNRDVLVDAFGNAIGNSIVSQSRKPPEFSSSQTFTVPGEAQFNDGVFDGATAINGVSTEDFINNFGTDFSDDAYFELNVYMCRLTFSQ